jgi:hypothetical protein
MILTVLIIAILALLFYTEVISMNNNRYIYLHNVDKYI